MQVPQFLSPLFKVQSLGGPRAGCTGAVPLFSSPAILCVLGVPSAANLEGTGHFTPVHITCCWQANNSEWVVSIICTTWIEAPGPLVTGIQRQFSLWDYSLLVSSHIRELDSGGRKWPQRLQRDSEGKNVIQRAYQNSHLHLPTRPSLLCEKHHLYVYICGQDQYV